MFDDLNLPIAVRKGKNIEFNTFLPNLFIFITFLHLTEHLLLNLSTSTYLNYSRGTKGDEKWRKAMQEEISALKKIIVGKLWIYLLERNKLGASGYL